MMSLEDKILDNTLFHERKKLNMFPLILSFFHRHFSGYVASLNRTEKCALTFRKCALGLLAKAESWLRNTSNRKKFPPPVAIFLKCAIGDLLKSVRYRSQIPATGYYRHPRGKNL